MNNKFLLSSFLLGLCLLTFGTNDSFAQKQKKTDTPANSIVPQVNPLVVELDTFEGHALGGERSYLGFVGNIVQGKVTYINAMARSARMSGRDALVFNKCEAEIGEPSVNKKGTSYSFEVDVEDVLFFNSYPNTDWHLSVTVYTDGKVTVDISSDSIARIYSQRTWTFLGHINGERTLTLKTLMEANPSLVPEEF